MDLTSRFTKCGLLNIQSVGNKTIEIRELIVHLELDLFMVVETWLWGDVTDSAKVNEMLPDTHDFYQMPRVNRIGGGVGIFLHKKFKKVKLIKRGSYNSFEHMEVRFTVNNKAVSMVILYRPPDSNVGRFYEEFEEFLDCFNDDIMITYFCGDFNIWMDDGNSNQVRDFRDILECHSLKNNVQVPTARSGHTLDLVLSDKVNNSVMAVSVEPDFSLSPYHKLVTFGLRNHFCADVSKKISFRNKKNFIPEEFIMTALTRIRDLESNLCQCGRQTTECINCSAELFRVTFSDLNNDCCPITTREVKVRESAPWFNGEIREARKKRRLAEKRWRRLKTGNAWECYTRCRNDVSKVVRNVKRKYYREKLLETQSEPSKLYRLLDELLGNKKQKVLPENVDDEGLANDFVNYFDMKVENIYNSFENKDRHVSACFPEFPFVKLDKLVSVEYGDFVEMFIKTKKTYCDSDPFPLGDLKSAANYEDMVKVYYRLVNMSMMQASFPDSEKMAYVTPIIKGKAEKQELSSYRPVSNLSFLSKMIEVVVQSHLVKHLDRVDVLPMMQSAYRKNHSTESALCAVTNDLLKIMDSGNCGVLILLDLSAAFDTVVHEYLLGDLESVGVSGDALRWFESYLSDRKFCVTIGGKKSGYRTLTRGVPQGSVLGPTLFNIYTIELSWILRSHNVKFKFFADDTQFYFVVNNECNMSQVVNAVMRDVKEWMDYKKLKLNDGKTDCVLIGTQQALRRLSHIKSIEVNGSEIEVSKTVRNLGVIFDQSLSLKDNILNTVRVANYHLRRIAFIKRYLDMGSLKKLIYNHVITRLDHCNSLYCNLPAVLLKKLQMMYNKAARLITGIPRRERITPQLIRLHWLPVKARIFYKICVMTYQALHTGKQGYLKDYQR